MEPKNKPKQKDDDIYDMGYDTIPFSEMNWWERILAGFFIGAALGIFMYIILSFVFESLNNIPNEVLTIFILIDGFIGSTIFFWGLSKK